MTSILRQLASKAHTLSLLSSSLPSSQSPLAATHALQPLTTLVHFRSFSTTPISFAAQPAPQSNHELPSHFRAKAKFTRPNNPPMPPWTPTAELKKRKTLMKRMGFMMKVLEAEKEEEAKKTLPPRPDFRAGDLLELKLSVPENKRRTTTFKGIVIARRNRGWRTSFTLRNFIGNNGGIERSFPLYSPHLLEVKVLETNKKKRYRRSKLYYLRSPDISPKQYRVV